MSINNEKLNNFISSITDTAKKQAKELNTETDGLINKELAAFKSEEKNKYDNYLKTEKQNISAEITKSTAMLKLEKKRLLFEKRNAVTDNVFENVKDNLDLFRKSEDYLNVLKSVINRVKECFPENRIEIVLSPNDKGPGYGLEKAFNCVVEYDDKIWGGILIRLTGTNITVDYTFNSLINDEKEKFLTTEELRISL
ncbi:MAG: V-type ATP synthase subunit E [Clostridiales bacterium]|nr:V-type ATP synthase subunit E [Clostridiales bacterium]